MAGKRLLAQHCRKLFITEMTKFERLLKRTKMGDGEETTKRIYLLFLYEKGKDTFFNIEEDENE